MTNKILVPIDFSDVTEAVVDEAQRLGKALNAELHLLHVATPDPQFIGYEMGPVLVRESMEARMREHRERLDHWAGRIRRGGRDATVTTVPGDPVEQILDQARRMNAICIVLGSHGHGALHHLLAGSVCTGVLRGASCPVHIVPSRAVAKGTQEPEEAATPA